MYCTKNGDANTCPLRDLSRYLNANFSVIVSDIHRLHMRLETIKFSREFDDLVNNNIKVSL